MVNTKLLRLVLFTLLLGALAHHPLVSDPSLPEQDVTFYREHVEPEPDAAVPGIEEIMLRFFPPLENGEREYVLRLRRTGNETIYYGGGICEPDGFCGIVNGGHFTAAALEGDPDTVVMSWELDMTFYARGDGHVYTIVAPEHFGGRIELSRRAAD